MRGLVAVAMLLSSCTPLAVAQQETRDAARRAEQRRAEYTLTTQTPIFVVPPAIYTVPSAERCLANRGADRALVTVADSELRETSGIAMSRVNDNIAWLLGDEPDARLTAVDVTTGAVRARITLPLLFTDPEDLEYAPCPDLTGPCIYVADTGDNNFERDAGRLFAVPEPRLQTADVVVVVDVLDIALPVWVLDVQYGDEALDVEALAIAPDATAMLFVEKLADDDTEGVARVFGLSAPWPFVLVVDDASASAVATVSVVAMGEVLFSGDKKKDRRVTSASWHPSGEAVVVRSHTQLWELDVVRDSFHAALPFAHDAARKIADAPESEEQGEAITYATDGVSIISTGEVGRSDPGPTLSFIPCLSPRR